MLRLKSLAFELILKDAWPKSNVCVTAKSALSNGHCVKYPRIRVFSGPYFHLYEQIRRFCPYTGKYRPKKTRILAYFMQWEFSQGYLKYWRKCFFHYWIRNSGEENELLTLYHDHYYKRKFRIPLVSWQLYAKLGAGLMIYDMVLWFMIYFFKI